MATFTLGLFIASFFVSVTPNFSPGSRGPGHKYHKMKKLRMENERLRSENLRLRNELDAFRGTWHEPRYNDGVGLSDEIFSKVPPVPVAPAAPRLAR